MTMKEMTTRLARECPVCSKADGFVLGTLAYEMPDDSPIASRFEVTACQGCGFVTDNTPSTQSDFDRYYSSQNYSPSYLQREVAPSEQAYLAETVDIISELALDHNSVIVDVGCGTGLLLEALKKAGYRNICGIDASSTCVELLTKHRGIPAYESTLLNPLPVQPDLITLFHVLEHIVDVKAAVNSIRNQLPTRGKILVEVPDTKRFDEFGVGKPLSYFYFTHLVHFDQQHLRNLFTANGFHCLNSGSRLRREEGLEMPCIWAVFEKKGVDPAYSPDFSLAEKIKGWLDKKELDPKGDILRLSLSSRPVYVWGIGIHAQMYLGMSPLNMCSIKALVDKNPGLHGKRVAGRKIESSDLLACAGPDDTVVITTVVHQRSMRRHLAEIGFKGQVISI